jgi:hypothetical protein
MTWVWEHSPAKGTELLTLLAIANNAADDGSNAWPSIARLAQKTRLDERTVRRVLHRLAEGGHLVIEVSAGPSGTNRYTVVMTPGNLPPGQNALLTGCPLTKTPSPLT